MECDTVQERILESFEEPLPVAMRREIDAHLSVCPSCAAFAARQHALAVRLETQLIPLQLSTESTAILGRGLRLQRTREWWDATPDILHLASCAAVTIACAFLLPFDASAIVGAGTAATALSYLLLATVRNSLEDVEGSRG